MNEVQILGVIISVLFSSLLTILITQVSGMRTDLKQYIGEQIKLNNRLIRLETEFNTGSFKHIKA